MMQDVFSKKHMKKITFSILKNKEMKENLKIIL